MNTRSEPMTPEFTARELLHSLHINSVPTPMEEVCARLGVTVERTGEIDAEALRADGEGEVIILLNQSIRSVGRSHRTRRVGHRSRLFVFACSPSAAWKRFFPTVN